MVLDNGLGVTYRFGGLIQSPNITNNLCDKILNNPRGRVHVNHTEIRWSITHLSLKIRVSSRASFIREFIFFCEYSQKLWVRKFCCQLRLTNSMLENIHLPFFIATFTNPLGNSPSRSDFFSANINPVSW